MSKSPYSFTKSLLIGAGIGTVTGALIGVFSTKAYQQHKTLNPDKVLESIKQIFLEHGPIEGAWIEFEKKIWEKHFIQTLVYTGGITRLEDGELTQYSFTVDAFTGTIIEITK